MKEIKDVLDVLGVDTEQAHRMPLILPNEIAPITDTNGNESYISFMAWDSEPGQKFDRENQVNQVRKGFRQKTKKELMEEAENEDLASGQAKRLAVLATGWHLVNPKTKQPLDIPFSPENALAIFSNPATAWIRRASYVWVANEANFMKG